MKVKSYARGYISEVSMMINVFVVSAATAFVIKFVAANYKKQRTRTGGAGKWN